MYLGHNRITEIRDTYYYTNIRVLYVDHNLIITIHSSAFKGSDGLTTLHLRRNKLKEIPVAIKNLENPQYLDISHNDI